MYEWSLLDQHLVADIDPSTTTMSKSRCTTVPAMRSNQPYGDWKKELKIWHMTNTTLEVDSKIQAGVLFESLKGKPRDTVLSELTVEEITDSNGIENIISTLDNFFIGNETKNAYDSMDDLMNFKCQKDSTLSDFVVEFQLKVNKVKASGTVLSDGVLGYTLLRSANLSEEKTDMIKATCDDLTYKNVKAQLEKIGFSRSTSKSNKFSFADSESPKVKVESFYQNGTTSSHHRNYNGSSSDEELISDPVFYSRNKRPYANDYGSNIKKPKLNPVDRFGHVRACSYCKCLYHWLIDCPYAPSSIKDSLKNKDMQVNKTL